MPKRTPFTATLRLGENPLDAAAQSYIRALLTAMDVKRLDIRTVGRVLRCDLFDELGATAGHAPFGGHDSDEKPRAELRARVTAWKRRAREHGIPAKPAIGGFVAANLALVGDLFGFDDTDRALLAFNVTLRASPMLRELAEAFGPASLGVAAAIVSVATDLPSADLRAALRDGRAVRSGLLRVSPSAVDDFGERIDLKDGLLDLVLTPKLQRETILARFLPVAPPSTLTMDDFSAVRDGAAMVRDLLSGAIVRRQPGVNILFHGPTGTGKTELARRLATELGASLHAVGTEDDSGDSPTSNERLSSLLLGQRLLDGSRAVLLFDELEDLFSWEPPLPWATKAHASSRMSKAWFNQLLEANPVPTVWISNNVDGVDPAFLRRFAFAVEFRAPGPQQRARMLDRHVRPDDALDAADVEAIAARYEVPAATLGAAVSAARLVSTDGRATRAGIERLLTPMARLVTGDDGTRGADFDAATYRLDALESPVNLAELADSLSRWRPSGSLGVTLCLHGPPGTGKTEFVRYLAHRMGRRVIYRRVSDIQSMWVGGTEKAIAAAFREAEDEGAVLLFDEADSFLRDRRGARASWEATQVNEFLQRLEGFRGIVACTTNLVDDLDPASLRRFVFKVPFGYLKAESAARLFESVFAAHLAQAPTAHERAVVVAALTRMRTLAPGDFAAVARRFAALGDTVTVARCVDELDAEVRAKGRTTSAAVGFAMHGEVRS